MNARYTGFLCDDAHPCAIGSGSLFAFQALTLAIRNAY